ncbi:MAG: methyltransferase domain-containing protein [Verrucomicrobia bacterium]|nr:methyltransferase domain-containing protein [Verrucomicrobiota bacterium]
MNLVQTLKTTLKPVLGRLAVRAFPGRVKAVEQHDGRSRLGALDRLVRFGLLCRLQEHERISRSHFRFWAGGEGKAFAENYRDRFESWFLSDHVLIVEELERCLAGERDRYDCLYEIGCGDGQVVNYLSTRLKAIDRFVGLDINEQVILGNQERYAKPNLRFCCGNAVDWIPSHARPRSVFMSNGGVMEYFSEAEIRALLRRIATDFKPSMFALVEPVAADFSLETETVSRPHGTEWSFTHNHRHLFTANGFRVLYERETMTAGYRWILMIAKAGE